MRPGTRMRTLVWLGAATLVILLARAIAYALQPSVSARLLADQAGGPGLPAIALVALALAAAIAVAICSLAALAVRERALLERRGPGPRFRVGRVLANTLALAFATSLAGGLLEAYIHWRAGLGWHGLHCLVGPVHGDLIPIEAALSTIAAAVIGAAEHLIAWMRRTFALLRALPPRLGPRPLAALIPMVVEVPATTLRFAAGAPRAPPTLS